MGGNFARSTRDFTMNLNVCVFCVLLRESGFSMERFVEIGLNKFKSEGNE